MSPFVRFHFIHGYLFIRFGLIKETRYGVLTTVGVEVKGYLSLN